MKIDGTNKKRENRDFGVRGGGNFGYNKHSTGSRGENQKNYENNYGYGESSPFKLKNSLIITPHYEVEFELTGGIRYVKNHRNDVLLVGDRINVMMNSVKKIPILLKREIDKRSEDKKIVVTEVYNFDDIYKFNHEISLFYDENKISCVLRCVRTNALGEKNIINSMSLGYSLPEVRDIIRLDPGTGDSPSRVSTFLAGDTVADRQCGSVKFDLGGASASVLFDYPALIGYGGKYFSMTFTDDSPLRFSFVFT